MIKLQVVGKDAKYWFVRNKGSEDRWEQEKFKKEIEQSLRLKERIKDFLWDYPDSIYGVKMREFVEESKK